MSLRSYILFILTGTGFFSIAQKNPVLIDSIEVIGTITRAPNNLSTELVNNKMAGDIGQLMPLFPGIQLRSYGGLGGLKTISFRSLSANHTSVVSDYFSLSQTQSGQNDLGQLPVNFVKSISLVWCDQVSLNYPVHSKLAGSILAIETYLLPDQKKFRLTAGTQTGSFGQVDGYLLAARKWKKFRAAVAGKIRHFNGNYPFSYQNASQEVRSKRANADLYDQYAQAAFTWFCDTNNQLHLELNEAHYNKGLPGAVVFYNPTSGQRLFGGNGSATLRHTFTKNKLSIASGISAQLQEVNYVDSAYLNTQGYLHNRYRTQEYGAQSQVRYRLEKHTFLFGVESRKELLYSNAYTTQPDRLSSDAIAGWQYRQNKINVQAQSGFTYIEDHRQAQYTGKKFFWQPSAAISFNGKILQTSAGFRYTVRQPSFTELYFNQYTIASLHPEEAQLYWLKIGAEINRSKWNISAWAQPFYTWQTNKILALPTKNLFVWSIQNIGKSDAMGSEANLSVQLHSRRITHFLKVAYTYQYTRDLTNPQSQSYGGHLAYMPLHSGSANYLFSMENAGFGISATYQGTRYTLNQNIPANEMESFLLLDISGWYKFSAGKHFVTVRAGLNNITNRQYAYIRYFVMPGINYTCSLLFTW